MAPVARALSGCLYFCLLAAGFASEQGQPDFPPDPHVMEQLRAGEVLFESDSTDEDGAAVSLLAFVRAPVERVWATIISCRFVQAFVAGLKYCEVLEERGDYALTRQVVDEGWAMPRLDYTFETVRQPYQHMEFRLTKGNLKSMHGSWDFETYSDGVLVRHMLALQPLLPAPRWLVRRNLRKDLPDMLRCIRGLSEGSGPGRETQADLAVCPGEVGAP